MPEVLKNKFNYDSLYKVAIVIQREYDDFQVHAFLADILDESWNDLELKARCRKITLSLGNYLPTEYARAIQILEKAVIGFSYAFFFPDFVEVYGQGDSDWDVSINALERNTEYWSSELASMLED